MKLKKVFKTKDNRKYIDLILEWEFDNRLFNVRINPVFKSDFIKLLAHAEEVK